MPHTMPRRQFSATAALGLTLPLVNRPTRANGLDLAGVREQAAALPRLHAFVIEQRGDILLDERFAGPSLDQPVNIKSLAKTIIATLVGCAIDRGVLDGPNQPIITALGPLVPANADPRLAEVTIGNLLSMQAGLERTSGRNYGAWVTSPDWVAYALTRPFVAEPGGRMLYSTGSSHLLSAILTQATGESTLSLARAWLGDPLDIEIGLENAFVDCHFQKEGRGERGSVAHQQCRDRKIGARRECGAESEKAADDETRGSSAGSEAGTCGAATGIAGR